MSVQLLLVEDLVGGPADSIGYPNISSCIGITAVMTSGKLAGTHLTQDSEKDNLMTALKTKAGGDCQIVVLSGAIRYWVGGDLDLLKQQVRGQFSSAQLYAFDTTTVESGAVFVLVTTKGASTLPIIEYKKHSKLEYSNADGQADRLSPKRGWVADPVNTTFSRKGGGKVILHEVKTKKLQLLT